ncbi:MAG: GntR family transcriptional regulator [Sphingomonas sp.]
MSPTQAMERSYTSLKQLLKDGHFPPGVRLEANRIADDIGVSMTPVRDALNRLVGEDLVAATSGEGFHVPLLSEGALRDLYEWNSLLLSIAIRSAVPRAFDELADVLNGDEDRAAKAALLFEAIAGTARNRELTRAILQTSDRLQAYRRIEEAAIGSTEEELTAIAAKDPGRIQAIRRYHLRRMRAAPDLVRHREHR